MRGLPELHVELAGTVRVVVLRGEHEVSTLRRLEAALATAVANGDGVVVDLAECAFIDSSCLAALVLPEHACRPVGLVVPPTGEVARLLISSRWT
jgi:anti-anti-sigma regulatory factor